MKDHENVNYGNENDVQSGEEFRSKVVVTVERNYDAEISLSPHIIPKSEVIERPAQPSNTSQEILNQAHQYHHARQLKYNTDTQFDSQKQYIKHLEVFNRTIQNLNEDECKSLVFAYNSYFRIKPLNIQLDKGSFKSFLVNMFEMQQNPIKFYDELMQFKTSNQLPDSLLGWLKEDLRSALHFAYLVRDTLSNKALVGDKELVNYILHYLKYEVAHFNNTDTEFPDYANDVEVGEHPLIGKFEAVKSHYFINRAKKEINWLEGDNSDQIEWAYNYLSSDKRDHLILQNIFIPVSIEDRHNLILASLDVLSNAKYTYETVTRDIDITDPTIDLESIPEISYRAKTIENMKDAWVKFSASNKNEELNGVEIYKKNKDQLDSIIKAKGTSAKKLISQFIENEYKNLK